MSDYKKFKKAVKTMILNLPDWAQDQEISLTAGMELLIHYIPGKPIEVKRVRCNFCGDCCMDYPNSPYGNDDEGKCLKLRRNVHGQWKCDSKFDKPYRCLQDPQKVNSPDCIIEHDLIDI
jgi:hypothetical protein